MPKNVECRNCSYSTAIFIGSILSKYIISPCKMHSIGVRQKYLLDMVSIRHSITTNTLSYRQCTDNILKYATISKNLASEEQKAVILLVQYLLKILNKYICSIGQNRGLVNPSETCALTRVDNQMTRLSSKVQVLYICLQQP